MKSVLLASVLPVVGAVSALAQDVEPVEVTLVSGSESSPREFVQLIPEGDERYSVANVCFAYEADDGEAAGSFGSCTPFADVSEHTQDVVMLMLDQAGYDQVGDDTVIAE